MQLPPLQITKVKIESRKNKRDRVTISWMADSPTGEGKDEFSISSYDSPRDSIYDCLSNLRPYVLDVCETAEAWDVETLRVSGVSFSYRDDIWGAVVTAQKKLENRKQPLIINTPYMTNEPFGEQDDDCFDEKTAQYLSNLLDEAYRYVIGDRKTKQLSLLSPPGVGTPDPQKLIVETFKTLDSSTMNVLLESLSSIFADQVYANRHSERNNPARQQPMLDFALTDA